MKKKLLILFIILLMTACSFKKEIYIGGSEEYQKEETPEEEIIVNSGRSSSIANPLTAGEIGLASKYNPKIKDYQITDVTVKVLDANQSKIEFDKYNEEVEKLALKTGFKVVVLEYETKLVNFETETFGIDGEVYSEVQAIDGNPLVYEGVKQVIDIYYISKSEGKFKNETAVTKIMFQVPAASQGFLLKLGAVNKVQAFFRVN